MRLASHLDLPEGPAGYFGDYLLGHEKVHFYSGIAGTGESSLDSLTVNTLFL